jgi:FkbM family methyltransferase
MANDLKPVRQHSDAGVDDELVYDVGAHLGEDSDFYLKLGYRVVAIEANPALADSLRTRFREQIDSGRYTLIPAAIGQSAGELTFFVNDVLSVWGTADPKWALRNEQVGAKSREIRVPCTTFGKVLKEHGCPKYLKIDIEGADMFCIQDLGLTDSRPDYLSIESTKTAWSELMREFDTLEALGYSQFKVVNQRRLSAGPFVTRQGQPITHVFETGASGPFGEDLGGPWLSKRQAIIRYIPIFIAYKTLGNIVVKDVLRRIPVVRRILRLVSWYDTHAKRTG